MNESRWSEARLEAALVEAGAHMRFPPTPDLAGSVTERLLERDEPRASWWRLSWVAAAMVIVGLAASLVLSGAYREAVASWLGVLGIRISFDERLSDDVGGKLRLDERVTLTQARDRADFQISVPAALGPPDRVYLTTLASGAQEVSMLYEASNELPEASSTGVGVLFMQFEARLHPDLVRKVVQGGTDLVVLHVDGAEAYWLAGARHGFGYQGPRGEIHEESFRLADNVLLWERDGIAYRIESALSLEQSLEIARSLQP